MWTVLLFLFLISSFDIGAASRLENAENAPVRFPRRFLEISRTRRVHIENQTGFDGKVQNIQINSEEDHPGVRAYGLPRKNADNNGHIDRLQKEMVEEGDGPRNVRAIEVYGKSKEHLETNGEIERVQPPIATRYQVPEDGGIRVSRSVDAKPKQEVEESNSEVMEAQDAKVFRPLFVYRQQVAKRQHRNKNQIHQPSSKIYYERVPIYYERGPVY